MKHTSLLVLCALAVFLVNEGSLLFGSDVVLGERTFIGADADAQEYLDWLRRRPNLRLSDIHRFLGFLEGGLGTELPPEWQGAVVLMVLREHENKDLFEEIEKHNHSTQFGIENRDGHLIPIATQLRENRTIPKMPLQFTVEGNPNTYKLSDSITGSNVLLDQLLLPDHVPSFGAED